MLNFVGLYFPLIFMKIVFFQEAGCVHAPMQWTPVVSCAQITLVCDQVLSKRTGYRLGRS